MVRKLEEDRQVRLRELEEERSREKLGCG